MQNIISLDTEKVARGGFQHAWGGFSPPLEKQGRTGSPRSPLPDSDAYEFLKTPSHRLVRGQYRGIVWAKEEGSWRDLETCVSPKVGGGDLLLLPFPGKWGASAPPPLVPPLFLRLWYSTCSCDLQAGH